MATVKPSGDKDPKPKKEKPQDFGDKPVDPAKTKDVPPGLTTKIVADSKGKLKKSDVDKLVADQMTNTGETAAEFLARTKLRAG
jgi:hypothetical protein